jgi:(p)ppGpp synthase/HD superfamily hydrolase
MNDLYCWETKFKYCCYSKRLLAKLLLLNKTSKQKINILEIKKAIYYAKKYHGDQKRQSGEPYYSHPLQVAYMVADHRLTTNILVTSILHDTIEDTKLTKEIIIHLFNSTIANQVEALTRIKFTQKISSAEIIKLLWLQGKEDLLLIKYFDRLHNMQTINAKSPEKILKTVEETFKKFMSLSIYFKATMPDLLKIDQIIVDLCYQQLLPTAQRQSLDLMSFCEDNFQLPFLFVRNAENQTKIL